MAERAPRRVWLIDEGSPGHRAQSEGVAMALETAGHRLSINRIDCRERIRGAFRPAARAVFPALRGRAALAFARKVARFEQPAGAAPDLILSSAGTTAFASRGLGEATGAPTVFVGNPKPIPPAWFDFTLCPLELPAPNVIATGIVPNTVTPEGCAEAASAHWGGAPPEGLWAMMIGGDSRNHAFDEADFTALAEGANALAARFGIRWLITTSRRTGEAGEALLEARLRPDAVEALVLAGRAPERIVRPWLGAAERVFVTQDSLTMLSEAISSGRPTTALIPSRVTLDPENFMTRLLARFDGFPSFSRTPCVALGDGAFTPSPPLDETPIRALRSAVDALIDALGWP